jgi:hypothetical protein
MTTPSEWWGSLPEETKDRLASDPRAAIPEDQWHQMVQAGADVAGAPLAEVQPAIDGFHLPEELAEFIERRGVRLVAD